METQIDGCPNSAVRTSDAHAIIPANWAGCLEEMLGYLLPFKRTAGAVVAQHHGSIHIGDIQEEILARNRRHVMDIRYLFTLGRNEGQINDLCLVCLLLTRYKQLKYKKLSIVVKKLQKMM